MEVLPCSLPGLALEFPLHFLLSSLSLGISVENSFDPSGAFVCEGTGPGGTYKLLEWRRVQQKIQTWTFA